MARSFTTASSQYLSIASPVISAFPVTMSCWLWLSSAGTTEEFCFCGNVPAFASGAGIYYGIDYRGDSGGSGSTKSLQFKCANGVTFNAADTATNTATNVWLHALGTFNATTFTGYVNGVSAATSAGNTSGAAQTQTLIGTGFTSGTTPAHFVTGSIADCAIWNVNLTQTEITQLANGVRPNRIRWPNLIGWWPLDGYQSPEPDLSGFLNNATLNAAPPFVFGPPIQPLTPRWQQTIPIGTPIPPFTLMPQIVT